MEKEREREREWRSGKLFVIRVMFPSCTIQTVRFQLIPCVFGKQPQHGEQQIFIFSTGSVGYAKQRPKQVYDNTTNIYLIVGDDHNIQLVIMGPGCYFLLRQDGTSTHKIMNRLNGAALRRCAVSYRQCDVITLITWQGQNDKPFINTSWTIHKI